MDDDIGSSTAAGGAPLETASPTLRMAPHWGVVLAGGVTALLLGAALAAWPGETVKVLAFLLAVQLIFAGAAQMFLAVATLHGAIRWAVVLAGALSLVIGALLLFDPLQTLTFVGWAVGLCVVAVGVADIVGALSTHAPRHRVWQALRGLLGVVIGLFLVVNPDWSLAAMVVITYVWLIAYGFITIVAALALRAEQRRSSA